MSAPNGGVEAMTDPAAGTIAPSTPGPPPLRPRIWGVLFRNEWFKTRKRLAFWLTLGFFSFITSTINGEQAFDDDLSFTLPEAWDSILSSDFATFFMIFASVALIMLASSEFSWRTARQNVIDGLSKTQWFWGKVMLLPILGLVFLIAKLGIGVGFAMVDTDLSATTGPAFPTSVLAASAGLLLAFFNIGGLALLLSTTIRSAGPAMAAWFFWIMVGEQLFPALLTRFFPAAEAVVQYFPLASAGPLTGFAIWDEGSYQRLLLAAQEAERAAPDLPDLMLTIGINLAWIAFFIGLAFVLFRRRDL
ncbi:MAG: hypothetical protein MJB57_02385 [Gemmatimonadetes bacterium]|nr:hypothetical protein [Gemmatimonadota bacterium]